MNKRQILFIVVGVANTAIDFFFLNLFAAVFGLPEIVANIFSVTIAILFSYYANNHLVFEHKQHSVGVAGRFLAVTLLSAYVVQSIIIYLMTQVWLWPAELTQEVASNAGLQVSAAFITTNVAKLAAVTVAAAANYFAYKNFVFKERSTK